jgi:hypothetical protein
MVSYLARIALTRSTSIAFHAGRQDAKTAIAARRTETLAAVTGSVPEELNGPRVLDGRWHFWRDLQRFFRSATTCRYERLTSIENRPQSKNSRAFYPLVCFD